MIIDRHNYEGYFLMYVDDELTAKERAEVELFVQQNADLAAELETLLETKLPEADRLVFADKHSLLKHEGMVNMDNYEAQFLLYIDKELNQQQKAIVERFVLQNPQLQDEFTLLKQTVLPRETIIFENKASLLKQEGRRIVPLFTRFAVAAAIIGIIALVWWMNAPSGSTSIAVVPDAPVKNNTAATEKNNPRVTLPEVAIAAEKEKSGKAVVITGPQSAGNQQKALVQHTKQDNKAITPNTAAGKTNNIAENNNPRQQDEHITAIPGSETASSIPVTINTGTMASGEIILPVSESSSDIETAKNIYAANTAYKELETTERFEDNNLYVGSMQINKNKMRGLVKKVGGLFSNKSKAGRNNEDGKLQVANLELNTN